ncbi:MAG: hypothetical protein QOI38_2871 [Sphingomonadales bacterium]|jgi:hypothetical protein|nr:hypothetical protein [Sphingomonadales bacterium]
MRKDETLNRLADTINVAQFVAFEPTPNGPSQTYARVFGSSPDERFADMEQAVSTLLSRSGEASVNVRSYLPHDKQSKEFVYGLRSAAEAASAVRRLTAEGLYTIVNETIDVADGGVSGVVLGDVIEFAPDATPRAVEGSDAASLPRQMGLAILETVYGFRPAVDLAPEIRLEFSLHPQPRGWRHSHTIGWEFETVRNFDNAASLRWPNAFSRMIGDKLFGLLVAHHVGLAVPHTLAILRRLAPFSFGTATGAAGVWLRTSPREQQPGQYSTVKGWADPFRLLAEEDPDGEVIASVLSQAAIQARWSGASLVLADGRIVVEGTAGEGAELMLGQSAMQPLPERVTESVLAVHEALRRLGPMRFEWVHDDSRTWVVQLHRGVSQSSESMIVPGQARQWRRFDPGEGLAALRDLISGLPAECGIELTRGVGLTSHVADVLRRAGIVSRFVQS